MSNRELLVLFPVWRETTPEEMTAWEAAFRHLSDYDWAAIGPEKWAGRFATQLPTPSWYWHQGEDGRRGYNPLLAARGLYEQIPERYSHLLVYQLDAIVLSDHLADFAAGEWDYIGAPNMGDWEHGLPLTLNGGFSLRRLAPFRAALDGLAQWPTVESYYTHIGVNEDVFWSRLAPGISPAPLDVALAFAWETDPALAWLLAGRELPMAVHGYQRHSPEFWENLGGVRKLAGLPPGQATRPAPRSDAPEHPAGQAK